MKNIIYFSLLLILFIGCGSSYEKDTVSTPPPVPLEVELTSLKSSYFEEENITIDFKNMFGDEQDWIGIYAKGSSNDVANILQRQDTNGLKNGQIIFEGIKKVGSYEAKAFFKDSLIEESSVSFEILPVPIVLPKVELTSSKSSYFEEENITIDFKNMFGDEHDWIGIYSKGSSNDFKNVLRRKDTNGSKNGQFIFEGINEVGLYEARAFFKDSLVLESFISFEILPLTVIYEDAENNLSTGWRQLSGSYKPLRVPNGFNSKGALVLAPEWIDNYSNIAEYQLDMNNSSQKILEMDMGGLKDYRLPNLPDAGYIQHYKVGVRVNTSNGKRAMLWDSFFNHGGVEPFKEGKWLSYPSPVEHVRGYEEVGGLAIDQWVHFRVDVEKELQKLEPDNKLLSIDTFFATGGFLDNLKLSTY